jgi:hypothetical protein
VRRSAIPRLDRFPRLHDGASSGRLVHCRQAAGGKRVGPAGAQIGTAHLPWALSDAAVLGVRNTPHGQQLLARLEHKHDTGQALTMLAQKLARAVSSRLNRKPAVARDLCLRPAGRGAGEPDAARDTHRDAPAVSVPKASGPASGNATGRRGPVSLSLTLGWDTRAGSGSDGDGSSTVTWAAPPPRPTLTGEPETRHQLFAEDGRRARHSCEGAENTPNGSLHWPRPWRSHRNPGVVPSRGLAPGHGNSASTRPRLTTPPGFTPRKTMQTSARRARVARDKRRPHTGWAVDSSQLLSLIRIAKYRGHHRMAAHSTW